MAPSVRTISSKTVWLSPAVMAGDPQDTRPRRVRRPPGFRGLDGGPEAFYFRIRSEVLSCQVPGQTNRLRQFFECREHRERAVDWHPGRTHDRTVIRAGTVGYDQQIRTEPQDSFQIRGNRGPEPLNVVINVADAGKIGGFAHRDHVLRRGDAVDVIVNRPVLRHYAPRGSRNADGEGVTVDGLGADNPGRRFEQRGCRANCSARPLGFPRRARRSAARRRQ